MQYKYDVFISYSRKDYLLPDGKTVDENSVVAKVLRAFDAAGITYWIDKEGIYSGSEFADVIGAAIEESRTFVFVSTVDSNKSEWTPGEIASAKNIKHPIIPFVVDDAPYNRAVRVFVAHLDFIDCQKLGDKAYTALVDAVNKHLVVIKGQELLEQEEEKKRTAAYRAQKEAEGRKKELQTARTAEFRLLKKEFVAKKNDLKALLLRMENEGLEIPEMDDDLGKIAKLEGEISNLKSQINGLLENRNKVEKGHELELQSLLNERDKMQHEMSAEISKLNARLSDILKVNETLKDESRSLNDAYVDSLEKRKEHEETNAQLKSQVSTLTRENRTLKSQKSDISTKYNAVLKTHQEDSGRLKWFYYIAGILGILLLFAVAFSVIQRKGYVVKKAEAMEFLSLCNAKDSLVNSLNDSVAKLNRQRGGVNYIPMVITNIDVGNVTYEGKIQTDYGGRIVSDSTMYLKPRISYYGLPIKSSSFITLGIKWYNSEGTLRTGSTSPKGYSFEMKNTLLKEGENTMNILGWGSNTKGNWKKGKYRLEIWYDGTCLGSKEVEVY